MLYGLLNEKLGGRALRDPNPQLHLLDLLYRIKEETTWDVTKAVTSLEGAWNRVIG
jgi:glyceraldehyde-3-phosphate dehydrogenase/erythrose-4-phosphate dehydrogenase